MAVNIRLDLGSKLRAVNPLPLDTGASRPLIARCVGGEDQAWRDLHREYHPVVSRFLRRMGVPTSDLEDVCQEVFVQVIRYLGRFEQRADFRTWLYQLCLSQAGRLRRRQHVQKVLDWMLGREPSIREPSVQIGCEPEWSASMAAQRVKQALSQMKPMHRTVIVLYEFEGVEGEEIARILGCPPTTVRRRLHYARQEFEALLCAEDTQGGRS
jgi:RNA polymerase sigma-70 factor (ECF subfamily)